MFLHPGSSNPSFGWRNETFIWMNMTVRPKVGPRVINRMKLKNPIIRKPWFFSLFSDWYNLTYFEKINWKLLSFRISNWKGGTQTTTPSRNQRKESLIYLFVSEPIEHCTATVLDSYVWLIRFNIQFKRGFLLGGPSFSTLKSQPTHPNYGFTRKDIPTTFPNQSSKKAMAWGC